MGSLAVVNGRIYVSFNPLRVVDGLLALNGKVVYIGSSDFVKEIAGKLNVPLLNLAGRVVLPGFVDSHLHIDSLGLSLMT
ncbi:MAG: amidohydrolase, partial [Desulfurococcaceae archaeon]